MQWRRGSARRDRQASVSRFAVLFLIVVVTILLLGLVGLPRAADDANPIARAVVTLLAAGTLLATVRVTRTSNEEQDIFAAAIVITALVAIVSQLTIDAAWIGHVTGLLLLLYIVSTPVLVLREVLDTTTVTRQTIIGAIVVYLLFGVALTFIAAAMDGFGAFFEEAPQSTAYVYFAFVTITSLGYGDLAPYYDGARMVSVGFAVVSQIYLVIIVARLVSLWGTAPLSAERRDDEP